MRGVGEFNLSCILQQSTKTRQNIIHSVKYSVVSGGGGAGKCKARGELWEGLYSLASNLWPHTVNCGFSTNTQVREVAYVVKNMILF